MPKRPSFFTAEAWQFNIDAYLNRFICPSVVPRLPQPARHFLGHRPPPSNPPPRKIGNLIVIAWAFVGVFCAVSVVNVVGAHIAVFAGIDGGVTTIGSFGAAAVLEFYAIESPLAQPRNAVLGQVLSSIIGVAVTRLFSLLPALRFEQLRWLAASLACAAATCVMALTGTVHPPAGATALIAVTDDNAYHIGWRLVPAVLLGSVLMQAIALLINNIQRRYPIYWWSPEEVGQFWTQHHGHHAGGSAHSLSSGARTVKEKAGGDDDKEGVASSASGEDEGEGEVDLDVADEADPEAGHVTFTRTRTLSSTQPLTPASSNAQQHQNRPCIIITRNRVVVPDSMFLRPEERLMLEALSERL